ncbi:TNT antitoxin family protein [Arthrobacter sp. FW305-123]|nr:TNT antitoxin family protein [Arthrobacter sp. FW305-123]
MSNEIQPMIDRLLETTTAAGYSIVTSQDGSWCLYNLGGEIKIYVWRVDDLYVLSTSERSREEQVLFTSPLLVDIELVILYRFTILFRRCERQPFLMPTSMPVVASKAAPGYTVSKDGTGPQITLIEFSHFADMSPYELWTAMNVQENSPFRVLT